MTSQVLGGAILAIGIAYIKVSLFLPEVTTHIHTHTHTQSIGSRSFHTISRVSAHTISRVSANAVIRNRKSTGAMLSPCQTPTVLGISLILFSIFRTQVLLR